ncbi:DUF3560 domain-containing protein [Kitasatospora sp. NPDC086791]|uniref:DUF3560 domain-containing protein n=1 Tax=Kitasatospora sp. NPDC086791 TaxID=3155178 RepID=UPI00343912DD
MNAETAKTELTIRHTWDQGTVLEGSSKGDGAYEIARRAANFRWMRSVGIIAIQRSRDSRASTWAINNAKRALEATGRFTVTVEIDNAQTRSFAAAEQERYDRAQERADRHEELADNAASRSDAAWRASHAIADGIPAGQPVLRGHHSEKRHRRDIARMDAGMRRSIDERGKAEHHADQARAAAAFEEHRKNPARTLRRIERLEADLRANERDLQGKGSSGWEPEKYPHHREELEARRAEITEQLEHWRGVVRDAEAAGFKVWGPQDFVKGDFLKYRGEWFEVLQVNPKSLTGPHIHNDGPVVTKDGARLDWTWTFPYNEISGRMSAEEMAAHLVKELSKHLAKTEEELAAVDPQRRPQEHAKLTARKESAAERLAYWRGALDEAEGLRRNWSKDDFTKGDFLRRRGRWFEVLRVNAKSLTGPHDDNEGPVVTKDGATADKTRAYPYGEISGRMSAEEMAAHLAQHTAPASAEDTATDASAA